MKAASIQDIKEELKNLSQKEVMELCQRLARFKKENKELLTYLLFEAHNEQQYVDSIKEEIDELFLPLPKANWYLTKKGLSKILRVISRYSKYTNSKETPVQLLLHFCIKINAMRFESYQLKEWYAKQKTKLAKQIKQLDEDLQYDYTRQMEQI